MGAQAIPSSRPESLRQAVHLAMLAFALLLRFLTWWQAALCALAAAIPAALLSPTVRRVGEARFSGVLLYPLSVLSVILLSAAVSTLEKTSVRNNLHIAAAAWAILAVGDSASNVFGRRFGKARLPWNSRKSFAGSAAMLFFSFPAALFFLWWIGHPFFSAGYYLAMAATGAFFGALSESLPISINDNLVVILASSVTMYALHMVLL